MLERLLLMIRNGGTLETRHLATELGAPVEVVEAMLEHLQRQNLIRDYVPCSESCSGCGLRSSCSPDHRNSFRLWRDRGEPV